MAILKKQRRKRARKGKALMRAKLRRRAGSRVGDDLVEAAEQIAAHLRGEIMLEAHDTQTPPAAEHVC